MHAIRGGGYMYVTLYVNSTCTRVLTLYEEEDTCMPYEEEDTCM